MRSQSVMHPITHKQGSYIKNNFLSKGWLFYLLAGLCSFLIALPLMYGIVSLLIQIEPANLRVIVFFSVGLLFAASALVTQKYWKIKICKRNGGKYD